MGLSLIVAVADNGVIGANGRLPWHLPDDLKRFKALTLGKPVIMGRKTWESLPRRPLPGRQNIVVSRQRDYDAPGARVVPDFESALWAAAAVEEIFVIGGAELYRIALASADRLYVTEIHARPQGDVVMPVIDRGEWIEQSRVRHEALGSAPAYSDVVLERRQPRKA